MPHDSDERSREDTPRSPNEASADERMDGGRWRVRRGLRVAPAFVVLLVLTTLVVPNVMTSFFQSRCPPKARVDIMSLEAATKDFALRNGGKWPDELEVLVKPDVNGERYLDQTKLPKDPWGRAYRYDPPGSGRPSGRIYTLGSDGAAGGAGSDADVDNRELHGRVRWQR